MNYENTLTGEVISYDFYSRLPFEKRTRYRQVSRQVTHEVKNNGDDFLLTSIIAATMLNSDNGSFYDSTPNATSSFDGFGGGDFGGGGASGSWDSGSSSSDSGSSYSDSGSSSDSGGGGGSCD